MAKKKKINNQDPNEAAGLQDTQGETPETVGQKVKGFFKRNKKLLLTTAAIAIVAITGTCIWAWQTGEMSNDNSNLSKENDVLQQDNNDKKAEIDQITNERNDLQNEVNNLKDNREFNPTEENIQTINGYKGILGGKITDLAQFDYNKSSKEVTLWFNATKNGENIMFAYTMKSDFKGDSCTTQDVMDLLKAKAESRELDVALYDDIEVVAQSAGAEAKAVASAIRAKVGGKGTATLTHEETGTEMEIETTERVYMSKKVTRDKAGRETVEITLATRDEDGKLKTQKVSTLAGEVYSNGDILNHIAKETGAEVKTPEVEAE